jgi:acyl-CoA thioesterase FadM
MDWMEHARAAVPADNPLHEPLNYGLARAIRLDVLAPVDAPTEVAVTVWLSRCGRTSYAMDHELTRHDNGTVIARARLVFVRVGADRRPAPVHAGLADRVHGAPVQLTLSRELAAPQGPPAYTRPFQVVPSNENRGRHVSHTQVVDFLDDTRRLALRAAAAAGGAPDDPRRPRAVAVDYEGEAHAGDLLLARVWDPPGDAAGVSLDLVRQADEQPIARAQFLPSP